MMKYPVNYLEIDNGEVIAYRKAGNSKRVFLLVHGNMSSSIYFENFMDKLSLENTVYAIDLPGFGDSSYKNKISSLYDLSLSLIQFIEKMDLRDIYLLGWSAGGGVCMETAAEIPDRIKKLFLLSSVGIKGYPIYRTAIFPLRKERVFELQDILDDGLIVKPVLKAIKSANIDLIKSVLQTGIFSRGLPEYDDFQKYAKATLKQRNLPELVSALAKFNMSNEDNGVVEGSCRGFRIECPIIIIHGDRDGVVDLKIAKETKDILGEKAELLVGNGIGHSFMNDDMELLMHLIKNNY